MILSMLPEDGKMIRFEPRSSSESVSAEEATGDKMVGPLYCFVSTLCGMGLAGLLCSHEPGHASHGLGTGSVCLF